MSTWYKVEALENANISLAKQLREECEKVDNLKKEIGKSQDYTKRCERDIDFYEQQIEGFKKAQVQFTVQLREKCDKIDKLILEICEMKKAENKIPEIKREIVEAVECCNCGNPLYTMEKINNGHIGYIKTDSRAEPSNFSNGAMYCVCPECKQINKTRFSAIK